VAAAAAATPALLLAGADFSADFDSIIFSAILSLHYALLNCAGCMQTINDVFRARAEGDTAGFANALEAAGLTTAELVTSFLKTGRVACMRAARQPTPQSLAQHPSGARSDLVATELCSRHCPRYNI